MSRIRFRQLAIRLPLVALPVVLSVALTAEAAAKETGPVSTPAAIRTTADAFRKAFNRGDAKAVADLWTPDGSLADDQGKFLKGRTAIENEYATFFKEYPGAKIEIAVQSIEVPAPDTAVEDGLARVVTNDGTPPAASRYTAVHVLVHGKWLMGSVRESAIELPSSYGRLRDFDWLIGTWETKVDGTTVHTVVRWLPGRSFLERKHRVLKGGVQESSGVQIIGWDPQAGKVRSWSFDVVGRLRHGSMDAYQRRLAHRFQGNDGRRHADVVGRLPCPRSGRR